MTEVLDITLARFGAAGIQMLPRSCRIGWPELVINPYRRQPMGYYDGIITDLLGRGIRVPDHPGACQARVAGSICGHGTVWHKQRTRQHPCEIAGCQCLDYVRMWPVPEVMAR
jgi:hypothetical protein